MNTNPILRRGLIAILIATLALILACGDDDPAAPPVTAAAKVLVLEDGGTEIPVMATLTAAGIDADLGPLWHEYDGTDLDRYDAVVFLNCVDYGETLPDSTQTRYLEYLAAGGGIVTMEWLTYYENRNEILLSALPVVESVDYGYEPETYTRMLDHPITDGLPETFATGNDSTAIDWTWVEMIPDTDPAKSVEVVFEGTMSGPVLVAGRYGQGRTVSWGMAGLYNGDDVWTDHTERLLVNIANWIAGK